MPFPESERVIFRRNPLTQVICQLRFPTILAVTAGEPAEFQERIRDVYPVYQREGVPGVPPEISELMDRVAARGIGSTPLSHTTHKFASEDETHLISLTQDFVAVTSSQYTKWEVFREEIRRAQVALEEIYRPSFYSRVGLRYQDRIAKQELGLGDDPWESCLREPVAGLLAVGEIRPYITTYRSESRVQLPDIEGGQVYIRYGISDEEPAGEVFSFDADFFTLQRRSSDEVPGVLDSFNRKAGNLFRWAITKHLRIALKPDNLD